MTKRKKETATCTLPTPADMPPGDPVHLRWLVRADMPEVIRMEKGCFGPDAWGGEEINAQLRNRNVIGMVAVWQELVVGAMIYELLKGHIRVLRIAVVPAAQRKGVGRQALAKLKGKLSWTARSKIVMDVPETGLSAQLFLRSEGFRAVGILSGAEPVCYRMQYVVEKETFV